MAGITVIVKYNCIVCGKRVTKNRSRFNMLTPPKYCSQQCHGLHRRGTGNGKSTNTTFNCLVCGVPVATYRPTSKIAAAKYCSLTCTGIAQRGSGNGSFTGGRHRMSNGYYVVLMPDHPNSDARGYVYEHRAVMERHIGRYLDSIEVVHHVDGNKTNNAIDNLELFASQSEHMKHHDKCN